MRILRIFVQFMIGVALVLWLLQLADVSRVLADILVVNPFFITVAGVSFVVASLFVALAFYMPLKKIYVKASVKNAILASFGGQLLSDVTPARSGYFLTPFILNRIDQTPVEYSMLGVVATGAMNLLIKAVLSVIALIYFMNTISLAPAVVNALLIGIFLLFLGGIGLLTFMRGRVYHILARFTRIPIIGRFIAKVAEMMDLFQKETQKIGSTLISTAFLLLLSIMANASALYFISRALQTGSSTFLDFALIVPLISTLNYIPITLAGLGVQETGYVALLTLLGASLNKAVAFSLMNRLLFTFTDTIGLPSLIKVGITQVFDRIDVNTKIRNGKIEESRKISSLKRKRGYQWGLHPKTTVYILLPCYNEEENLEELVAEISRKCESLNYKIVAVDDGSKDATYSVLCCLSRTYPLVVLRHEENRGLHEALRTLLLWVDENTDDSDYVILMDSDLTHSPEYIPQMIRACEEQGADIVIASRFVEGGKQINVPFHRSLLSKGLRLFTKLMLRLPVEDVSSGYRCIRSAAIKRMIKTYGPDGIIESKGFDVQLEILFKLFMKGAKIAEIPFTLNYSKKKGKSKLKLTKTVLGYVRTILRLKSLQGDKSISMGGISKHDTQRDLESEGN